MDDKYLAARLKDLANLSENRDIFTFSDFLSPAEAALVPLAAGRGSYALWGGMEGCERVVARFGDENRIGYEAEYPVSVVKVASRSRKFSDELTHRDFLGALMHLGIERSTLGDILVRDGTAWVFALDHIAPMIAQELTTVRHTSVECTVCESIPEEIRPVRVGAQLIVPSVRMDAVIARLYHLPRGKARELFAAQQVFVNGAVCPGESTRPKIGDVISVRGHGKFVFSGAGGETKKGKIVVDVEVYA